MSQTYSFTCKGCKSNFTAKSSELVRDYASFWGGFINKHYYIKCKFCGNKHKIKVKD